MNTKISKGKRLDFAIKSTLQGILLANKFVVFLFPHYSFKNKL